MPLQPKNNRNILRVFAVLIVSIFLFAAFEWNSGYSHRVSAQNFVGPTQSAGVGQGAIGVDSSNNLAIGTSTPQSDTKLLIVGTSTTGGYFAIKVLDMNRGPLFIVRSDGSVSIGSPYVQSNQSSATTTVSGVGAAPANGALFVNGPIFTTLDLKANGISVGTTTPQSGGNIYATGNITAATVSGSYSGTINAANTSAGAFGSNTGNGNYSFPASLSVGTSTAPTGGIATFMGNVGIGTTGPSAKLDVVGNIALTAGGTAFRSINFQNTGGTMTFGKEGSAAGTLLTGDSAYANVLTTNDTNPIQFGVNDSVKMTILSTGNVGIGTTGPRAKLEIQSSDNHPSISMHKPGVVEYNFGIDLSNTLHIGSNNPDVSGADSRPFVLTTGGNVGIGTTSPGAKLDIKTSNETVLRLTGDGQAGDNPIGTVEFYNTGSAAVASKIQSIMGGINHNQSALAFFTSAPTFGERMRIDVAGNVGIGTTAPSSTLHVVGTASFSQPVIVGTPTATGHAATKSYVDSTVGGSIGGTAANALACSGDSVCDMSGANLNGGSITGVNKLTVTTIDPLYSINGKKYSTYAASFAGGVKEEYTGKAKLSRKSEILNSKSETNSNVQNSKQKGLRFSASNLEFAEQTYQYIIDFDKIPVGSDLWVWYKAIDFSKDSVEAVATPYGQAANIWYEIIEANRREGDRRIGAKIIFHGDKPAEFSFRLTGKRFDWQKWPTLAPDQTEETSLIIN